MKKNLFIFAATIVCVSAAAQNARIARAGFVGDEILQPQTTLYVDITIEQQEIIAGPYARYAQKYLGVSAPLTDKVLHEIKSTKISDNSESHIDDMLTKTTYALHMDPDRGFPKLPIDRTSSIVQATEESARLAATKIFEIRKSRFELITAEAGENVFGAGLASALHELSHLENEYLSLFLGKQTVRTTVERCRITPKQEMQTYTVCRFSDTDGFLPQDDPNGLPVVLELKAQGVISTEGLDVLKVPTSKTSAYRIADDVGCRIILGDTELVSAIIPVFQFGQTVYVVK